MGKKQDQKSKHYVDLDKFPIKKNKTYIQNLKLFLSMMKAKHSDLPTHKYLTYVHRYIKKYNKNKAIKDQKTIISSVKIIQICKKCDKWAMSTSKLIKCLYCQDYYHKECIKNLNRSLQNSDEWICKQCDTLLGKKQLQLKQHQQSKPIQCSKCHKKMKQKDQLKYCMKCQQYFDKKCFKKDIICGNCDAQLKKKVKQIQSTLLSHGFKSKSTRYSKTKKVDCSKQQQDTQSTSWTERLFRSNFPKMQKNQIKQYQQSLLRAILIKNMDYTEQLKPINISNLDKDTEQSLDFTLSQLHYQDKKIYDQYKKQPIGPFKVEFKQKIGFDVIADMDLPKNMIVCEYIGEVVTLRQALESKENDSLMQLKVGKNSDQTLIIRPQKYTNIARFINGVNNKSKEAGNVSTTRKMVGVRPAVILFTNRKIKKGESLLYNYNAGGKNGYDTSHFV